MLTELCTNLDDYMRSNKNITNMRATILLTFKKMFLDAGKSDLGAVIQQLSKSHVAEKKTHSQDHRSTPKYSIFGLLRAILQSFYYIYKLIIVF
ncbi:hypothetical protein YQE_01567, partial [Dendroctonus ponderosae]